MGACKFAIVAVTLNILFAVSQGATAQGNCGQVDRDHNALVSVIQRCQAQMTQQVQRMQQFAPQGIFVPPAQCQGSMPQWIAQLRYVEAQMGHCQGDYRTLCEQQGYPSGCEGYRQP